MRSVFRRNSVDFVLGFVNRVAPGCVADVSEGHANSTCHIPYSPLLLGSDSLFYPIQWAWGNTHPYNLTTFAPHWLRPQGVSSKFLQNIGNTVHNHTAQKPPRHNYVTLIREVLTPPGAPPVSYPTGIGGYRSTKVTTHMTWWRR